MTSSLETALSTIFNGIGLVLVKFGEKLMSNGFESISAERKHLQSIGEVPSWYTTQGYALFTRKYSYNNETVKGAFNRIASTLAKYYTPNREEAFEKFFNLMWDGKLSPSTPVMSNTGTNRGMSVSCAGNFVGDSVEDFYDSNAEIAILSKHGFGTASYLGGIRPRGSLINSTGAKADGVVPVFDTYVDTKNKISQGSSRRGEWAGYLDVSHGDFWELTGYLQKNPASANIGWVFELDDVEKLMAGDQEAINRWNEIMYMRCRTGKGYMWKNFTANELAPQPVKNSGIKIRSSQLCTEIALPSDEDHTFTCILSSLNLAKWDEITDEDIQWALIFLDCVCEDFLGKARNIRYMEKAVRFTEKARALGLGTLGFHTYLQSKMIAFESFDAHMVNNQIYKRIWDNALKASQKLSELFGEPEWCVGTGQRNATLITIAPNMSSALLCGSVSQGVEPLVNNAYIQQSAGGDFVRYNPHFVDLAKKRGKFSDEMIREIAIHYRGSVQHLDWLTDEEKLVFRTAYEINQHSIIRLASSRQQWIDQAQSINLFFSADEDEAVIADVHKEFLLDPRLKSLYYLRSERGVKASTGECIACEG
ncbi:putative ribonucleoside-diphosphate reductase alpha chain [Aeromonas phage LAh_6]|uniref:Ribonucleoside-diphosphate reductase n=1 Tax=Aeromonas phage LAh_6 TaxID=2591030 RepID=A0A513ZZR3_9CAUD|nr:ribonucleotide reductase [Aeromonas phage LAh_6]QDH46485.1 putative ribonucleoside-diphosphate reductase alpha chain [Aeromonas phage LAh_6]